MIRFKNGQEAKLKKEFKKVNAVLLSILEDMSDWLSTNYGLDMTITDILSDQEEDKKLGRTSVSHREGRAVDIRVSSWPVNVRTRFESHFESKYKDCAGISASTGKENLILIHNNGNGIHCHIQVRKFS